MRKNPRGPEGRFRPTRLLLLLLLCLCLRADSPFLVKPYLQLGAAPRSGALSLLWHAPDRDGAWAVAFREGPGPWTSAPAPTWVRVAVPTIEAHRVYTAPLGPLRPGAHFQYRVRLAGAEVFRSEARIPPGPDGPMRVAVSGDLGRGGKEHLALVAGLCRQRPDLVVLPGDLVYEDGRLSEYRQWFFPLYNADAAPLLRSTLVVGALGNHDVGERGPGHPVAVDPDSMGYYLYWDQPLNGPRKPGAPPLLAPGTWGDFLAAAGGRFPTMGTFSFDAGPVHWTVLDSNPYARWDREALQDWLARDLEGARGAAWRFVVFHHPPFNFSATNPYKDLWMGRLWPIFERHGVDLVFTGHIHTYARSRPLHFRPEPRSLAALDPQRGRGFLKGDLTWDAAFDGVTRTRAGGPILIVTGAGGAPLHLKGKSQLVTPEAFVAMHLPDQLSFSVLDIRGKTVAFRQVDAAGRTLDRFSLTR